MPSTPDHPPGARLTRDFFDRDATVVARELLGCIIRTRTADGAAAGRIVEAEAYRRDDSCSHSARGPTARNATMFGRPGGLYVYLIYGLHHCVNLVTAGDGAAVLLRGLVPVEGAAVMRLRRGEKPVDGRLGAGPGNLARALGVDRGWDGLDVTTDDAIAVYAGAPVDEAHVVAGPRVGVVGLPEDVARPWRWRVGYAVLK
ncbi:MAG: mgh [Myxococcaceae bacterium]|nr:mgh [Myxococcaceae bacterium]